MTRYVATINVPGYLPMDDEPPVFDDAASAWDYLASEREISEDSAWTETDGDNAPYSDTVGDLQYSAEHAREYPDADPTGSVHGGTPGYDGDHDLGLAYSVSVAECDGCDQDPFTAPVHYGTCPLADRD